MKNQLPSGIGMAALIWVCVVGTSTAATGADAGAATNRFLLDDLQRQAAISNVPLLLGEWGAPTRANTDGNPAERRYPRGFRVEVGPDLTLAHDAGASTLRTVRAADSTAREQARQVRWDDNRQLLLIAQWVGKAQEMTVRVLPGMPKCEN